MTSLGVDFAFPSSEHSPEALKAAGVTFVMRYISTPGNSKNLTPDEYVALKAAGLEVFLIFETYRTRPFEGPAAGAEDVVSAEAQADALGYPLNFPIVYACDVDAESPTQIAAVDYYMAAIKSAAKRPIGLYAGTTVLDTPDIAKHFNYGVQSAAWAHEPVSLNAHIIQKIDQLLGCDQDEMIRSIIPTAGTDFHPAIPVVSVMKDPVSGYLLLAEDGAIYNVDGSQYYGGANNKPYFAGRTAKSLDLPNETEKAAGKVYVIVATSGERYAFPE